MKITPLILGYFRIKDIAKSLPDLNLTFIFYSLWDCSPFFLPKILHQNDKLDVLSERPSSFFKFLIRVVLKLIVKFLKRPSIKKVTNFVPIVSINSILFDEQWLLICTKRYFLRAYVIILLPFSISLKSVSIKLRFEFSQLYKVYLFRIS